MQQVQIPTSNASTQLHSMWGCRLDATEDEGETAARTETAGQDSLQEAMTNIYTISFKSFINKFMHSIMGSSAHPDSHILR